MDLEKHWPYLAGAGLLIVLILLSRANGGGSTEYHSIAALPDPGGDALALAKEQDRAGVVGKLLDVGGTLQNTALGYAGAVGLVNAQGAADVAGVNARYAGEGALADIQSRTQSALAHISADRDVSLGDIAYRTNVAAFGTAERVNAGNNATARAIADGQNQTNVTLAGVAQNTAVALSNNEVVKARTAGQFAKDTARAADNTSIVNGVVQTVGNVFKAINPFSWF
jgi:hypothetical protein